MGHSLQPTALVHEAYLKILGSEASEAERTHFLALASRAMRQVLIDHARIRGAKKRGGDAVRTGLSGLGAADETHVTILAVNEALEQLARLDSALARLVELRIFGGMTETEAARELGVSRSHVTRKWRFVRAWLASRLADFEEDEPE